jgi:hypothetical protein
MRLGMLCNEQRALVMKQVLQTFSPLQVITIQHHETVSQQWHAPSQRIGGASLFSLPDVAYAPASILLTAELLHLFSQIAHHHNQFVYRRGKRGDDVSNDRHTGDREERFGRVEREGPHPYPFPCGKNHTLHTPTIMPSTEQKKKGSQREPISTIVLHILFIVIPQPKLPPPLLTPLNDVLYSTRDDDVNQCFLLRHTPSSTTCNDLVDEPVPPRDLLWENLLHYTRRLAEYPPKLFPAENLKEAPECLVSAPNLLAVSLGWFRAFFSPRPCAAFPAPYRSAWLIDNTEHPSDLFVREKFPQVGELSDEALTIFELLH